MLVEKITSRQNPLVKRFRRVRTGAERHLLFIEGVRLVEDALSAGAHFESVAFSPAIETTDRGLALLDSLQMVPCRGAAVSKSVMDAIADTETPQGIAALVSRPHFEIEDVLGGLPQLVVIADQLQDPGNLGTLIRTAEAAGVTGFIATRYTVDAFNLKALRASMGSAFRLPLVTDVKRAEVARLCRERNIKIVATRPPSRDTAPVIEDVEVLNQIKTYADADFRGPVALVLGRESTGISDEALLEADLFVEIPMAEGVESLNVASAGAVLLYEAARQRGFGFPVRQ